MPPISAPWLVVQFMPVNGRLPTNTRAWNSTMHINPLPGRIHTRPGNWTGKRHASAQLVPKLGRNIRLS